MPPPTDKLHITSDYMALDIIIFVMISVGKSGRMGLSIFSFSFHVEKNNKLF